MSLLTDNIFCLLKESGKTQKSLAEACGVDVHTVSRWKKGRVPHPEQIEKIAEFFGISVGQLYHKKEILSPLSEYTNEELLAEIKRRLEKAP